MKTEILNYDCLDVLSIIPDECIDSMVTDPPAGISFMGKDWDNNKGGKTEWIKWLTQVMEECLRVLKPGAHALVWAIPRTSHWTGSAIEDAGFEVRDVVTHLFGSGFPKSQNISKMIDKAAGAKREIIGINKSALRPNRTDDQCELGCAVMELDEQSGQSKSISSLRGTTGRHDAGMTPEMERRKEYSNTVRGHSDAGGASRFFYCAKASKADKNFGCDITQKKVVGVRPNSGDLSGKFPDHDQRERVGNFHPTVKSTKLMSYLIKLITPPGGVILDPFMGSGSTGVAALKQKFRFIGIEQNEEYFKIAKWRLSHGKSKSKI